MTAKTTVKSEVIQVNVRPTLTTKDWKKLRYPLRSKLDAVGETGDRLVRCFHKNDFSGIVIPSTSNTETDNQSLLEYSELVADRLNCSLIRYAYASRALLLGIKPSPDINVLEVCREKNLIQRERAPHGFQSVFEPYVLQDDSMTFGYVPDRKLGEENTLRSLRHIVVRHIAPLIGRVVEVNAFQAVQYEPGYTHVPKLF